MDQDRNLLFGVFAVQLKIVTPSQIMAAAGAWATDPSLDLPERLLEDSALSPTDRHLIQGLVDHAVKAHDGDAAKTLATFGGNVLIQESFSGSIVRTDSGMISLRSEETPTLLSEPVDALGLSESPGRYSRESEHARGGMGRVLLVHDEYVGRDIALKELLPTLAGSSESGETPKTPASASAHFVHRFLQEARITGQLEHPSIVPVYEVGRRMDGSVYYTMKLVKGKSLSQAIKDADGLRGRLNLLSHFVDLCQAIAYAHTRGVIHRDIKPHNVMVGEFGETVVIDWGLVKILGKEDIHAEDFEKSYAAISKGYSPDVTKTAFGQALGTPCYMPPEQARGKLDFIDERSDVYSLGAVLYELLTGQPPHKKGSLAKILNDVVNIPPTPIAELSKDAPAELIAICERAMAKNPGRRYHSAKELADDIMRYQTGALVGAYEYSAIDKVAHFIRRHKGIATTAALSIAVLIVLTGVYVVRITAARDQEAAQKRAAIIAESKAVTARNQEAEALRQAEENLKALDRSYYISGLRDVAANIGQRNPNVSKARLLELPEKYRNWEWGYLYKALDISQVTFTGHYGSVNSAAFSPDGSQIVSVSDGTARIWNAASGEELLKLSGNAGNISSYAFSLDGSRIVSGSSDTARIWDAASGNEILALEGHLGTVLSAGYSRDGLQIVTASKDRTAKVWEAESGRELLTLKGHTASINDAAFDPDGSRIVTASVDSTARVWDSVSGAELLELQGHDGAVQSAEFSPDGSRIVTASVDSTASVWDAVTGDRLFVLYTDDSLNSASYNFDGSRIVTSSYGKRVELWEAEWGNKIRTLKGHTNSVLRAVFSPGGGRVVSASVDGTVKVWDIEPLNTFGATQLNWNFAALSHDGSRLVAGIDNRVKVWDVISGNEVVRLRHGRRVSSAVFSLDGSRIVGDFEDDSIKLWDATTGEISLELDGPFKALSSTPFSPDGTRLVLVSKDNSANVWDAESGQITLPLVSGIETIDSIAFSSDGSRIIGQVGDGLVKVWDAESSEVLFTIDGLNLSSSEPTFSSDESRMVAGFSDNTAKVWNTESGDAVLTLIGHIDAVFYAGFNPDGMRVVTGAPSEMSTTKVWDAISGKETGTPSEMSTIKVWDAVLGKELVSLKREWDFGSLLSADYSSDGRRIMASYEDRVVKMWDSAPWKPDVWSHDNTRSELTTLAQRTAPKDIAVVAINPISGSDSAKADELSELATTWSTLAVGEASDSIREVNGQGILILEPESFPTIAEWPMEKGDLIIRVNATRVDTLRDAGQLLKTFLLESSLDDTMAHVLTVDVVNTYDYKRLMFTFPGLLVRELQYESGEFRKIMAFELKAVRRLIGRRDLLHKTFTLISDWIQLDWDDRTISLNGVKIDDYPTLLTTVNSVNEELEDGTFRSMELVVYRGYSRQYIRTVYSLSP